MENTVIKKNTYTVIVVRTLESNTVVLFQKHELVPNKAQSSDTRSTLEQSSTTTTLLMEGRTTTKMEGWLRKRGKYHHISSHW